MIALNCAPLRFLAPVFFHEFDNSCFATVNRAVQRLAVIHGDKKLNFLVLLQQQQQQQQQHNNNNNTTTTTTTTTTQ
jgi:hypothetical protein